MYKQIKELREQGFGKRRTARILRCSRDTVSKYWNMTEEAYVGYYNGTLIRAKKLDEFRDDIIELIEKYPEIPASVIHDKLQENGRYGFTDSTVRKYVARLRDEIGILIPCKIRQYSEVAELPPGFQAQIDLGETTMPDIYGGKVKIFVFAVVFSHSRKKFIYFQDHKFNGEEFINAHDLAFKYFGGRPEEIVYDQDRVLAVSENAGDIILTEKFSSYCKYAGFSVRLCRGNDPESKGKIEAVVKYVKQHFLRFREYSGVTALNTEGLAWLERTANSKKHETTKLVPNVVFEEIERKTLKNVPSLGKIPEPQVVFVKKTNVIHYKSNRYAVPKGTYAPNKTVMIEPEAEALRIVDRNTGEILAEHIIYEGTGKYIPLPKNYDRFNTNSS